MFQTQTAPNMSDATAADIAHYQWKTTMTEASRKPRNKSVIIKKGPETKKVRAYPMPSP